MRTTSLSLALRVLAMGVLLALSVPGIQVARAESGGVPDIAPSADQLFGLGPAKAAPAGPTGSTGLATARGGSCDAAAGSRSGLPSIAPTDAFHVMAQLMELGDEGRMLNGRGYNYPSGMTAWHRMQRLQLEIARQEAAARR